jgi:hypothetical protein
MLRHPGWVAAQNLRPHWEGAGRVLKSPRTLWLDPGLHRALRRRRSNPGLPEALTPGQAYQERTWSRGSHENPVLRQEPRKVEPSRPRNAPSAVCRFCPF